jgi:hypothetical protein
MLPLWVSVKTRDFGSIIPMAPTDPGERMGEAAWAPWTEAIMKKRVKL